jgi:hypothetical protein
MRRWLRGSSSRDSEETPKEKPKYHLPRAAEVRPCDTFLKEVGIYEDSYFLADNAGIIPFLQDKCDQYLLLTNTFVQNFRFYPRKEPPMVEFNLYDVPKEMTLYDFCNVCKIPYEAVTVIHVLETWKISSLKLLWGKREECRMREWLVYIFLFYVTMHYLPGDD